MDTTRVNTDVLSGIVQHHGLCSHLSEKESPWQEDSEKLTRTTCFDPPPFHRCQSGHQRQCQSHRRWCYSIGSLEIMSLWLPRRYWIRAWEPVWRRAVQQYSSRVQSTEYRVQTRRNSRCLLIRTPAPPAAGNHNKTLVKCSCNLRFYPNLRGRHEVFESYSEVYIWYTLTWSVANVAAVSVAHIQSVSIILVGNEVDVGDVETRISF